MLFGKITLPSVVTLLAIIIVAKKMRTLFNFLSIQQGMKIVLLLLHMHSRWEEFGKGDAYYLDGKFFKRPCLSHLCLVLFSGRLFLASSNGYLQVSLSILTSLEWCVILKQVRGRICLLPAEPEGSRYFLSPPQGSWRARCDQAWLTRCAIQEE